jgi:glycosyltransferase involved in cell wall biosynthesis
LKIVRQKKNFKITFVCRSENLSGGQRVIAIYAEQLTQRGHRVTVVIPKRRRQSLHDRARALLRQRVWASGAGNNHFSFFRNAPFQVRRLAHPGPVTDRDLPDADVVIAGWWETAEWVAALSPCKGTKIYFVQHHEIHDYLPMARVQATYRLPFRKIVVAPWLRRIMSEQYGDDTVDVVPNSVDRTQFFAPVRGKQHAPTVGFLYASASFKGLDMTLAALQIVRKRIPNLRMVAFGSERPNRRLPLPAGTEFYRSPPQDEIRNLYARCDAWITASRSEGFNLPALEAMACRTPVISTRTGWPEDAIVTDWNGVLVDINDVAGLAQGIEWVLSRSDEEWKTLSANAFATASAGSWEKSVKMFEQSLEHAWSKSVQGEPSSKTKL